MFEHTGTSEWLNTTKTIKSSQRGHKLLRLNVTGDCPQNYYLIKEQFSHQKV